MSSVKKGTATRCETRTPVGTDMAGVLTALGRLELASAKVPETATLARLSVLILSAFVFVSILAWHAAASESKPLVILLGDSIRMNYQPVVREKLKDKAIVWSPKENGQDTTFTLRNLEKWLKGRDAKVVHINVGLHDLFLNAGTGKPRHSLATYDKNLRTSFSRLRELTDAKIIFALTTPVLEERQASSGTYGRVVRRNADVDAYNARAREIAEEFGIAVNDLNGFIKKAGVERILREDGIHLSPAGCEMVGMQVANEVSKSLAAPQRLGIRGDGPTARVRAIRARINRQDIAWMREATEEQLRGCRVKGKGGIWLHTPDGVGNYRALWTRDFTYMVEYAGDLFDPNEIKQSIQYLLAGQRADGCMPDRVNVAGKGVPSPGPERAPLADHALDNGTFMAKLVCCYAEMTGDLEFFRQVEPAVRKGLDHTRRAANGLVYNPPEALQCPYGFTDTIAKTGHLLCCSVLYYDACTHMERLCRRAKCGDPDVYRHRAELIRKNLGLLWNDDAGMFWAADRDCKQIDIWGSALAAHVGCATDRQADRVACYLVAHYDEVVQRGQVRHLPAGETWQRFMRPKGPKPGTYQNGAFWATPVAWIAPTIARCNVDLAVKMVKDVIADFRQRGIMECINGDYHAVPKYVASATNVYGLLR